MPRSTGVLLFITFHLATAASAQPLVFDRDDYASVTGARAIAVADFNRDGWPDIAQANSGRNTVTTLINRGGNGLVRTSEVSVGTGPFDLAAGDFNRDGIPDLAVANADSHSISILLGRGTGAFTRSLDIAAPSASPRGLTTADVNHDGRLDLVYSGFANGVVQVLLGNGAGGFSKALRYAGPALQPQGIASADFNHDGHADVAVAYAGGNYGLRVLYNDAATGTSVRTVGGETSLNVLAVGDLNGDGWTDVAAASTRNSRVGIYVGSASGLVHTQTLSTGPSPRGIAILDVNGDGVPDVVTANRASSTVTVFQGDPAHRGSFLPAVQVPAGSGSRAIRGADFNGDGRLDLATGNEYAAAATVLTNTTILKRAAYVFGRLSLGTPSDRVGGPDDVWPADFNRDARLDVLTLAREDPWTMSLLVSGGSSVLLTGSGPVDRFAAGDINDDGNPDVIYKGCCPTGVIHTYVSDGRGGFVAAPQSASAALLGDFATGDLDRDGRLDLVFEGLDPTTSTPVLHVMIGAGNGTFSDGTHVTLPAPGVSVRVADVNRDGTSDAVVLLANSTVQVWFGSGSGGFSASPASVAFPTLQDGADVKVGDLNRDGYLDLVAGGGELGAAGGAASVIAALGSATEFHVVSDTPVTAWGWRTSMFVLADVNVDGDLDLVTAGGEILLGRGDGTFDAAERFDYRAWGLRVEDYTRDGLPDIVFGTSQGEVGVLVNERSAVNRPPVVSAGPDLTIPYEQQVFEEPPGPTVVATGSDPDQHALTFEWRDASGALVSNERGLTIWRKAPGRYEYTLRAEDGRGAVAADSLVVTIANTKEIVLHLGDDTVNTYGSWHIVSDLTAADWQRAHSMNFGAPKLTAPLASPISYVTREFVADPTQTYKLWLRLKADGNAWANDSVWVQFSGATDLAGNPRCRPGTTSGLAVSLEECSGCGVSGWGWEDDGWGAYDRNGVLVRFPEGGVQRLVIQAREDGVSVDHVVLSAEKYLAARPGAAKRDTTILPATYTPF